MAKALAKLETAPDCDFYLHDDGAGEFEIWIEDFYVLGSAPTRKQVIADAARACRAMAEALEASLDPESWELVR